MYSRKSVEPRIEPWGTPGQENTLVSRNTGDEKNLHQAVAIFFNQIEFFK